MVANIKAIEVTGQLDGNGQLHLDEALPMNGPSRVRIILLFEGTDEMNEPEWLRAGTSNPEFGFLTNAEEDIYTSADGKPFND